MTEPRSAFYAYLRTELGGAITGAQFERCEAFLDALHADGAKQDISPAGGVAAALAASAPPAAEIAPGGPPSAILRRLVNKSAPALTDADFLAAAAALGVSPKIIRAVKTVEAGKAAFDTEGRPTILYEKHVFHRNTGGRFAAAHPDLSAKTWQPGTYGPLSAQYGKLARAAELDAEAAFKACSWGAFQVLGENAKALGYPSAIDMALALAQSEAAHLDSFVRFVKANGLVDELQRCRAGDPASCVPFVSRYNGGGYAKNAYHIKLAEAAK